MKKWIAISTLLLTAGLAFAAGVPSRSNSALGRGAVLNPFTLQVVSASRIVPTRPLPIPGDDQVNPSLPLDPDEGGVRPGPFTPPPRSPYAPPPR